MSRTIHIVCPDCQALNRLPAERLAQAPNCGKCHRPLFAGHPSALTGTSFARHLQKDEIPLVVDFWAPWCGPCKMMAPEFERAAQQLEPAFRLAKVDTEAEPALGSQYGIRSIPTMVLFRGGREIARQSGAMRAADIVRWVQSANAQSARAS